MHVLEIYYLGPCSPKVGDKVTSNWFTINIILIKQSNPFINQFIVDGRLVDF